MYLIVNADGDSFLSAKARWVARWTINIQDLPDLMQFVTREEAQAYCDGEIAARHGYMKPYGSLVAGAAATEWRRKTQCP